MHLRTRESKARLRAGAAFRGNASGARALIARMQPWIRAAAAVLVLSQFLASEALARTPPGTQTQPTRHAAAKPATVQRPQAARPQPARKSASATARPQPGRKATPTAKHSTAEGRKG